MANKTLTANVKFNTKSAEASLTRLSKKIDKVQKAVTKTGTNAKLAKAIDKAVTQTNKLTTATNKWATATNKVATTTAKVANTAKKVNNANLQATNSARKLSSAYRSSNASANGLLTTVKRLAATYLGVMGTKAVITQSDVITSAENRLNNLEGGNASLTQTSMDKTYAAAQRSRSGYGDMLSNVSKSMTLAGDAFQGNVDNAIRFQEIMAKAYTIGGASAAEQASSMYQLVQALGSGVLQGDELRSVREGAPIAYKKIEEFCQGVLNTEESLKDLASQGVVTSDIIVAAIMASEEEINNSFNKTKMTFAQAWTQIKNTALKAFEPVLQKLNQILNSDLGKSAINGVCNGLVLVANFAEWALTKMEDFINWCCEHWDILKWVIIGALTLITSYYLLQMGIAIYSLVQQILQWSVLSVVIFIVIAAVLSLLIVFLLWRAGAISTCQAIITALLIVGIAVALVGLLMGNWIMVIVGLVIAAIGLIIHWLDYFLAVIYSVASVIWNIIITLVIMILQNAILPLTTAWDNFANFFGNLFNDPIAAIIRCFENLADSVLSILETIAKGIDAVFGSNLAGAVQGWRSGLSSMADNLVNKYGNGTYEQKSDVTGKVNEILSDAQNALLWNTSDAWDLGMDHGANAKQWLNEWGSQFQNQGSGLGLGLGGLLDSLPDPNGDAYGVGNGYDPSGANDDIQKALDDINGNTGDIADSMELTQEDLAYLRRIADMEWKKEFTTATIKVDMSNYNTIGGEGDLDGIVDKLADKLYEEMQAVANGVYE